MAYVDAGHQDLDAENEDLVDQGRNDPEVDQIMKEFSSVFRNDLPAGLPPQRDIDNFIQTDPSQKPPHCPIFHLSPSGLMAKSNT